MRPACDCVGVGCLLAVYRSSAFAVGAAPALSGAEWACRLRSHHSLVAPPTREWSREDACDIDGQAERPNGAYGKSDIEGKTAREAASELGKKRVSNERERMSQSFRSSLAQGDHSSRVIS